MTLTEAIRRWSDRLAPIGSFRAGVLTLTAGTGFAQLIPLAVAPFLSRLYSPSDFGLFALFIAIVSILATIASGRFEFAITLPESDEDALHVSLLAILLIVLASAICLGAVALYGGAISRRAGASLSSASLHLVPLGLFLTGFYQVLNLWLIRKKMFARMAWRRVIQFGAMALAQIAFGFADFGSTGLVLGYVLGQVVGYGFLAWQVWSECSDKIRALTLSGALRQAVRYRGFALYSVPSSLCSTLTGQSPSFCLNYFFGAAIAGFYDLPRRLLAAPSALLSSSILDVFNERASRDFRTGGTCRDIYVKTFKMLLALAFVPYALLFLVSPWLVPLVFGAQWETAGLYARYLSVSGFMSFVASPLGYVLLIAEKQLVNLLWQASSLVLLVLALCLGAYLRNPAVSILGYALSNAVMCGVYIVLSYRAAGRAADRPRERGEGGAA